MLSSFPLTEKGGLARGGLDLVSSREFYFSDVSRSGLVKPDGQMIYIPLEEARRLCGMDGPPARISAIHIRFSQGVKISEGTGRVRGLWQEFVAAKKGNGGAETLGDVRVQNWKEYRREMIAPMEKEQAMMSFLFVMLGIITVFIVFVVFYMVVGHKSRDIGIFKSIGMSQLEIGGVFMGYAAIVGVLGSAVGIAGGWVFLWRINELEGWLFEHYHWQLWDRTIYAIGRIPNEVSWPVVAAIGFFAVGSCLFGAFLPSAEAARQDAVRVLQVSQV
jgi:lipoprotein-releasing system permease protein